MTGLPCRKFAHPCPLSGDIPSAAWTLSAGLFLTLSAAMSAATGLSPLLCAPPRSAPVSPAPSHRAVVTTPAQGFARVFPNRPSSFHIITSLQHITHSQFFSQQQITVGNGRHKIYGSVEQRKIKIPITSKPWQCYGAFIGQR